MYILRSVFELGLFLILFLTHHGYAEELVAELYRPTNCDQVGSDGGFLCNQDCSALRRCFKTGNTWREITIDSCDANNELYCNAQQGKCTEKPTDCDSATNNPGFYCSGIGSFPDPYDCQKFYVCFGDGDNHRTIECPGNTAYNSMTNDCSRSTSNNICTGQPHFVCNENISRGIWRENPNLYYYCFSDGKITMLRCEDSGKSWDRNGKTCGSSSSSGSVSPDPGNDSSESSFVCTTSGLFPDNTDCNKYYICSGFPVVAEHRSCPTGFYFNTKIRGCKRGTCRN